MAGKTAYKGRNTIVDIDEIAVERACYGDPVRLTTREKTAVVAKLTRAGMSAKEIARRLRCSMRTVQRHRALVPAEAIALSRVEPRHGTRYRYLQGCHCDLCRRANTQRHNAYMRQRRARLSTEEAA